MRYNLNIQYQDGKNPTLDIREKDRCGTRIRKIEGVAAEILWNFITSGTEGKCLRGK